jgi:phage tail sheath protein FI
MPASLTYPGVYIEEIPSGVRTITGVATSITAFVGRAITGPPDDPTVINSFSDFERIFGGLGTDYPMSYAVQDFYLNGGAQAVILRLFKVPAGGATSERLINQRAAGACNAISRNTISCNALCCDAHSEPDGGDRASEHGVNARGGLSGQRF